MAVFNGTQFFSTHRHGWVSVADEMHGTSGADTFNSGGGNDRIYAGAGSDEVNAGAGDDLIVANPLDQYHVGAWGHDAVYGGSGNDILAYGNTTDSVILYGDDISGQLSGNDTISGGTAGDHIYGGWGNDTIWGGGGNDVIYGDMPTGWAATGNDSIHGGDGYDQIYGGDGNDTIWGDSGFDDLYGGKGADTFGFAAGDSGAHYADADVIHDFNASTNSYVVWDKLDLPVAGTASNFGHIKGTIDTSDNATYAEDFNQAKAFAQNAMDHSHGLTYEFVTDGTNGWLFADFDRLHGIDFAIELKGVTDLSHLNIV